MFSPFTDPVRISRFLSALLAGASDPSDRPNRSICSRHPAEGGEQCGPNNDRARPIPDRFGYKTGSGTATDRPQGG